MLVGRVVKLTALGATAYVVARQVQAFSADTSHPPSTAEQPRQRHFSAAFEPFVDLDGGAPSIFETFTPVLDPSASVHSPSSFAASALR